MSSRIIRTGVVALGATLALGGVAWGASAVSASPETPAVSQRVDGEDSVVLVADDDDDDPDGAGAATRTGEQVTKTRASRDTAGTRATRDTRGTRDDATRTNDRDTRSRRG